MNSDTKAWIGIDVSKDSLDVCVLKELGPSRHRVFDNTPAGHRKLLSWVQHQAPACPLHFALEATGSYGTAVATFLVENHQPVSVLNPARVHYAAQAQGVGNKTDKADAQFLATYCRKENPPLWRMARPEVQVLVALVRRCHDLKASLVQEKNRLQTPGLLPVIVRSLKQSVRFLEQQIASLEQQIRDHIDQTPSLKEDRHLLLSIPGIGETTAAEILAELPDVTQFACSQDAAAYAGLNPRQYRSGSSVSKRTQISKQGNASLRRALYLPAMAAIQYNPLVKALYERLVARGLCGMAALAAAMRKLLILAVGVLKSREKFDPDWQSKQRIQAAA